MLTGQVKAILKMHDDLAVVQVQYNLGTAGSLGSVGAIKLSEAWASVTGSVHTKWPAFT